MVIDLRGFKNLKSQGRAGRNFQKTVNLENLSRSKQTGEKRVYIALTFQILKLHNTKARAETRWGSSAIYSHSMAARRKRPMSQNSRCHSLVRAWLKKEKWIGYLRISKKSAEGVKGESALFPFEARANRVCDQREFVAKVDKET